MAFSFSTDSFPMSKVCNTLIVISVLGTFLIFVFLPVNFSTSSFFSPLIKKPTESKPETIPTNLTHLGFGILGSERAMHYRKGYVESWWRPNGTRGFLYLDENPTGDLIPWSNASPPYKISQNLTQFVQETQALNPIMIRMVNGIMEVFRELDNENMRWLVMGDDDSLFFVDNIVAVLAEYDHTKYYYLGGQSEFVLSNYWFSFIMGFGGAGFMLSYPLAKALANDMESCLRRYAKVSSADLITMVCIADIGVNLSPQKGIHQIDLHGDISGLLSSHPKFPIMSLHHFDAVEPIFPAMDRAEATRHLMTAAAADQSRMMQQTICYQRQSNWSISVSWGYSAHIYEKVFPRSYLQNPIETFQGWTGTSNPPPHYMFNTRLPSKDPCEAPHVFFFKRVEKASERILTTYSRVAARGLPQCSTTGNGTADFVEEIWVFSPATKRKQMDRCECCDIVRVDGAKAELEFRECNIDEIIA